MLFSTWYGLGDSMLERKKLGRYIMSVRRCNHTRLDGERQISTESIRHYNYTTLSGLVRNKYLGIQKRSQNESICYDTTCRRKLRDTVTSGVKRKEVLCIDQM